MTDEDTAQKKKYSKKNCKNLVQLGLITKFETFGKDGQ